MKWTKEKAIAAIQARAEEIGHTPTTSDMGGPLAAAAFRLFGTIAGAQIAAGLDPNCQGRPKMGPRTTAAPEPKPEADPVDTVALYGIDLDAEREKHLERMRRKYAADPPRPRYPRRRKGNDFYGRARVRHDDAYLPPDDLTVPHRRTG